MGTQSVSPTPKGSPKPAASAAGTQVDIEMLRNLDLISNIELLKEDVNWEVLEALPNEGSKSDEEKK